MSEDVLAVVEPGLSTSVQDFGRHGSQRYGVSVAGAADPMSFAIANHLVGNPAGAAALELTMTGGVYDVLADDLAIALAGADMPISVGDAVLAPYQTHILGRGDRLRIGAARSGLRAYLAISGGIGVPAILGSRSTHWRTGLGGLEGRMLTAGDRLPGQPQDLPPRRRLLKDLRPYFGGFIPIVAGPQADAFDPAAMEILVHGRYRLSARSDRMGALLDGPQLPFHDGFNIVSDGIVAGSIQVPGHGQPLVLLADRQTTGGYPKIATVTTPGLCRIAQRRPNERIRFQLMSADEAEERYRAWRTHLDRLADMLMAI
ncbi:biotin-dependent carboxyltransferase family protein [Mangrovicella endophytica]|uniref:5-oxoprolinase subunit C family protein n=1 Tax=Mangrovicella endophytica TaxID=2066697 RepID=UPI000C9EC6B4|nr:biotin-dependent carboxyltransferase family protein [Mangrovicella endophytica]